MCIASTMHMGTLDLRHFKVILGVTHTLFTKLSCNSKRVCRSVKWLNIWACGFM